MQESQLCGMKSKIWVPTNQQTDRGCCGSKCSLLEVNRPLLCLSLLLRGSLVDSHQRRESSLVKDFSLIKTQITVPTTLMFPSTVSTVSWHTSKCQITNFISVILFFFIHSYKPWSSKVHCRLVTWLHCKILHFLMPCHYLHNYFLK